ncbi:MAG: DNA-directed DNA polymerase [archaeon]
MKNHLLEKALLLDANYIEENNESKIMLYLSNENGHFWVKDNDFSPYFFVAVGNDEASKTAKELLGLNFGDAERFCVKDAQLTNAIVKDKAVIKVTFFKVSHLVLARKIFSEMGFERYEYDVPFAKRYLLDMRLQPGNWIEYFVVDEEKIESNKINEDNKINEVDNSKSAESKKGVSGKFKSRVSNSSDGEDEENTTVVISGKVKVIKEIKVVDGPFGGKGVAFDLETKMGKKFTIGGEPILMVSIVANDVGELDEKKPNYERVISHGTKKVPKLEILESESEVVEKLIIELNKNDTSYIITYNGDNFDFAYTKERAKKLGLTFEVNGFVPLTRRHGLDNAVKLQGIQHIDSYQIMRFLQRTGAVNTAKLDIESVSEKVFGEFKEKVLPKEITEAWESKDVKKLARLVDYNLKDSRVAFRIAQQFLPLFVEISKLTSQTLYDTTRSTTSQMVEDLLLKETHYRGIIAPNKPKENEVIQRTQNPIKGAFVKEPMAGLHENIAVLDFASLYPSIITSHNISPDALNCAHDACKKNISPDGTWFCTKKKGLFPEILEKLLKQRLQLKREYKRKKKEEGIDDRVLFAKQWALKIILNSVYGYLGYPRARWYSRECASATTAWEREYIHETIKKSEVAGFKVLYGDTDSNFLLMLDKTKKDVENFVEEVNSKLPEGMELEIDGFYKRGIFVTKKEGGAAKKRYALMDEKGNLKIVGFEYVRRDWCIIARETQKKVLELVLSEGKPEKAVECVKRVLKELKEGKVEKKDLVIMTVLQRDTKDYDSIGPHVAAAKKAIARGKELGAGSMLSFIITKGGKGKQSISDKAELEEYVKEGDYDVEYYIENQLLPAVLKIVQELGYSKEDLLTGGKQTGLNAWG